MFDCVVFGSLVARVRVQSTLKPLVLFKGKLSLYSSGIIYLWHSDDEMGHEEEEEPVEVV